MTPEQLAEIEADHEQDRLPTWQRYVTRRERTYAERVEHEAALLDHVREQAEKIEHYRGCYQEQKRWCDGFRAALEAAPVPQMIYTDDHPEQIWEFINACRQWQIARAEALRGEG